MPLKPSLYKGPRGSRYYIVGMVNSIRVNKPTPFGPGEETQAKIAALETEREILLGTTAAPSAASLSSLRDLYCENVGSTTRLYIRRFCAAHGKLAADAVTPALVLTYVSPHVAPATRRRELVAIQGFVNFALKVSGLSSRLHIDKPSPSEPKATTYSSQQRDNLLRICASQKPWFLPHLLTYFLCGLRRAELCKLQAKDVITSSGSKFLLVRSIKGAKRTPIVRRVAIHPYVLAHLQPLLDACSSPDDYVFRSSEGFPLHRDPTRINKTLNELRSLAGTSDLSIHDMRRTFASGLLANGVGDHVISNMLGHIDTKMLKVYAIVDDQLQQSVVSKIAAPSIGALPVTQAA